MPALNYNVTMRICQVFELADTEAHGFAKFDPFFDVECRLGATFADVDMNRSVIVAVKEKPKAVFNEHRRHS